jgi:hypothetical protein
MRKGILAVGALASVLLVSGCAARVDVGYRVYDPYYRDYHVWGPDEGVYYDQWIGETHHPSIEYRRLNRADQRAYWNWRHSRPDRR